MKSGWLRMTIENQARQALSAKSGLLLMQMKAHILTMISMIRSLIMLYNEMKRENLTTLVDLASATRQRVSYIINDRKYRNNGQ